MRGLYIDEMVTYSSHGTTRIRVDATEFNRAMNAAQEDIAKAMYRGSGDAFSYAKTITENYLRGYVGMVPQANKVANSLDYDKRESRVIRIEGDDVELEAKFGSRGPDVHGGEIGVGVHTKPDDNGGRWNIAQSLQEGIDARTFAWKSSGAAEHSRQVGSAGGDSPWYPGRGTGEAYFYGFPELDFLGVAERAFRARLEGAIEREMKRRLE